MMKQRLMLAGVSMLTLAVCAGLSGAAPASQPAIQRDLQQLQSVLNDESSSQSQRDEAARRLVSRQSREADLVLSGVLENFGNRVGQLAVARALSLATPPREEFITPLFALVGPDKVMTDAAVSALAEYKTNNEVLTRLITVALARQQREAVRITTISALGRFIEKRAARTLVEDLLNHEDESPAVRNAAADALAEMTGLRENERDLQRWHKWWVENRNRFDADFKAGLLAGRATRFDQMQNLHNQLIEELQTVLEEQYQGTPESLKPEMLTRYLRSSQPELRAIGARIIYDDSINNRTIPAAAREQLRVMVGDSSAVVRRDVARALRAINDAGALDVLLTQLGQETDADARAAIIGALSPIRDLRTVPVLLEELKDPTFRVAVAAADALKELGPSLREKNAALADQSATLLRQIMERHAEPAMADLQQACLEALIPLRMADYLPLYLKLLKPEESIRTHRAALRALGELRDPRAADGIVSALEDPEAGVRLEALVALGKLKSAESAEKIYRRLDPNIEPDSSVQKQAWMVLEGLLPLEPKDLLVQWAERFNDAPERRRAVLQALADQLQKENNEEQLANVRKSIGETLMKLDQPTEAAGYFSQSLDYWKTRPGMVSEALTAQLFDALLKSRQYHQAIALAAPLLQSSPAHQQTVGPLIDAQVEQLNTSGDLAGALDLISETNAMTPPLATVYREHLQRMEVLIRRKMPDKTKPPATAPANH